MSFRDPQARIWLREYEKLSIGARDIANKTISGAQADALHLLETNLPSGAFSWGHKNVKFTQFCGVIQLGDDMIEVLPKIYGYETHPEVSREILIRMLEGGKVAPPRSHGGASVRFRREHLLDVFIRHFCSLLFEQIGMGRIRVYLEEHENLSVVKGRIHLPVHLKLNAAHREKVFCVHDELKVDNDHNQVIKATLRRLFGVARASRLRQQVTELLFVYEDVTDVAKYSSDVDMLHTNRLTDRYSEVFEYCRLFLDGISPDVFVGDRSCAAIMFDMNKVFEDYVSREMRKAARRAGFRLKKQGPTRFVVKRHATGENLFQMKPDLSLWNDSNEAAGIIDCKWKMLDSDKAKFAITQSDIYQMVAYGNRYDCGRLMLLYPAVAAFSGDVIKLQVIDDITTILVAGIDLAGIVGFGESIGQQIDVLVRALVEIEPAAPAQF